MTDRAGRCTLTVDRPRPALAVGGHRGLELAEGLRQLAGLLRRQLRLLPESPAATSSPARAEPYALSPARSRAQHAPRSAGRLEGQGPSRHADDREQTREDQRLPDADGQLTAPDRSAAHLFSAHDDLPHRPIAFARITPTPARLVRHGSPRSTCLVGYAWPTDERLATAGRIRPAPPPLARPSGFNPRRRDRFRDKSRSPPDRTKPTPPRPVYRVQCIGRMPGIQSDPLILIIVRHTECRRHHIAETQPYQLVSPSASLPRQHPGDRGSQPRRHRSQRTG